MSYVWIITNSYTPTKVLMADSYDVLETFKKSVELTYNHKDIVGVRYSVGETFMIAYVIQKPATKDEEEFQDRIIAKKTRVIKEPMDLVYQ
jgi:hypothetical protein